MELNIATKGRAASLDVRKNRNKIQSDDAANLPSISNQGVGLPGLVGTINVAG